MRTFSTALELGSRAVGELVELLGDLQRVMRFARGALDYTVRPDDIFISSYPRSGTTWMQYILHLLLRPEQGFEHISQVVPWFERSLAVGTLTAADLEALPSPRVYKSHLPYRWLPRGARYIYVVRDGRDVAVSYYHFYRSHLRYDGDFDRFYRRFLRGRVQYRSWFKHVAAWEAAGRDDPRVLILRYEELRARPDEALDSLVAFLDLPLLPGRRRDEVLERSSFEQMKRDERKFDFATEFLLQSGYSGRGFLRGGRTGDGQAALSAEQQRAFALRARRPPRLAGLELDLPQFLR